MRIGCVRTVAQLGELDLACIKPWAPSPTQTSYTGSVDTFLHNHSNSEVEAGGSEVQGHPLPLSEFQASLENRRPHFKTNKRIV